MTTTEYDVDFFMSFFGAIPEEQWCLFDFISPSGRSCALGHCGARASGKGRSIIEHTPMSAALRDLFNKWIGMDPMHVNDSQLEPYVEETAKARILAALADIKAKQLAQQPTSAGQDNLQQCGTPVRDCGETPQPTVQNSGAKNPEPLLQSPVHSVTAALAKEMPCVHMWMECGVCILCSATKPAQSPVKEGVV